MEKTRISELEANKGANVEGEIIKLDSTKEVRTKFGKATKTQNLILKDSSGEIELSLWAEECDTLNKGDKVNIEGFVKEYKGKLQLSKGKFGKIEKVSIESEPLAGFKAATTTKEYDKSGFVPADKLEQQKPLPKTNRETIIVAEWAYGQAIALWTPIIAEKKPASIDEYKSRISMTASWLEKKVYEMAWATDEMFRKGGV